MGNTELIDRLCGVTTALADIVRAQAAIIEQHGLFEGNNGKELIDEREAAYKELDVLEYALRGR